MDTKYIVVLTTFSKAETGEKIINSLLTQKLAACIQSLPIKSSYTWKGEVCRDDETLLLIKTKAEHYPQIEKQILEVHDYETPEIISIPMQNGSPGYTKWIDEVTS